MEFSLIETFNKHGQLEAAVEIGSLISAANGKIRDLIYDANRQLLATRRENEQLVSRLEYLEPAHDQLQNKLIAFLNHHNMKFEDFLDFRPQPKPTVDTTTVAP